MDDYINPFTIGHHNSNKPLPVTTYHVNQAHEAGYNLVTSPITTSHFHSRVLTLLSAFLSDSSRQSNNDITSSYNASPIQISPLTPADTPLSPGESISQILGTTSPWIDLCSPDPVIADISRQVLKLELQYAAFCGIAYVLIPGPSATTSTSEGNPQFARAILESLGLGPYMQLYIWLPMISDPTANVVQHIGDLAPFARAQYIEETDEDGGMDLFRTWEAWDYIRSMCKYSTRLSVALSVQRLLPPAAVQSRWYSEPVRLLSFDATTFTKNPKGYPVLSKAHQVLVSRFAHFKQPPAWFLLCDVDRIPSQNAGNVDPRSPNSFPTLAESSANQALKDPVPHLSYMRNLQTKQPTRSAADRFGAGYQDYLQAPLQPLTVNLESITYEVFEKDPVKYEWYERAVARALHDWIEQGKPTSNPDGRVVVAVVGAGRGPLVSRALNASDAVGVEIDMWALEKNPNAFVLLQQHNISKWDDRVNLVKSDMRTWRGPTCQASTEPVRKMYNVDPEEESMRTGVDVTNGHQNSGEIGANAVNYKIDILISELLGSFADNELSPECLDGVQHLLNPVHGISIPASYTAHITPIAAPKLHADISLSMVNNMPNAAEIPYVVMLNAVDFLSTNESTGASKDAGSTTQPGATAADMSSSTEQTKPQHHQRQQSYSAALKQNQAHPSNDQDTQPQSSTNATKPQASIPTPTPVVRQTWAFHHPNPALPSFNNDSTTINNGTHEELSDTTAMTTTTTTTSTISTPTNAHNARHSVETFPIPHRATCHGLAGYFEAVLYPGVELSTNPLTMAAKSEDMISWFPIYFPLKTPLSIPDNSLLQVNMWRQTDDRKVWYEWIVDVYSPSSSPTHTGITSTTSRNSKKKWTRIGGSELHSSEKEACLM